MTVLPVNVDDDLIELLDARVAESSRSRSEILAAAIRRGFGGGCLAETLATYRTGEEISEDDTMAPAKQSSQRPARTAPSRERRPAASGRHRRERDHLRSQHAHDVGQWRRR